MLPIFIFNTSIREVLKTPQLFFHFTQHQKLNANIGFLDFLDMHYLGHDLNDNDEEEDMKLPFKKVDSAHVHISIGVPTEKLVLIKASVFHILNAVRFYANVTHSDPTGGSLFRPPIVTT